MIKNQTTKICSKTFPIKTLHHSGTNQMICTRHRNQRNKKEIGMKNSKVKVEENDQEINQLNDNKQGQSEEQWAQEILFEQGHENEQK